ncbi:TrkH family potassium uptake protein [Candidatus Pelagibacter bacterium]|jgi:trk system potassium uptake protein TrkH|nr:TrkH family potassium uptake protein [Candidatus Pelagibacter bacterium]
MNFKKISFYLSLFCFPVSFLSFINILYASYFDYFLSIDTYFITLATSILIGLGFLYYGKKSQKNINFIEQLILIICAYILTSILISIPFYLSNYQVTFINSIFESISGLTGTGFSIFKDIKYLDPTLILWRSSSQWLGGLFFLFFLLIIFSNKSFNYKMTNLTYSGDSNFTSESNIKDNLFKIFIIYSLLSIVILSLLNISGVRLFNSLNLSMTLISGGGFLPIDSLGKIISTNFQKIILIFSFMISMLNFYLLLNIFNKNILTKDHKEDLYLVLLFIVFCCLIYFNNYNVLDIIISVSSSLANSGLTLMESDNNLSLYFLLITIIGGSLISNSSGIKLTRFYILLKITSLEIIKLISPNSIINKTIFGSDKKIIDDHVKISFLIFISFFLSLFILSSLLVVDNIGFEKSFKLSILTLTNTVNSEMYNMQNLNFANLLTSSKISLILFMIIGKIELISIFLIFKKILFKD